MSSNYGTVWSRGLMLLVFALVAGMPSLTKASLSIDIGLGMVKGIESGLTYDVKGRTLYDGQGNVLQKNVVFVDLLTNCETVGTAGRICLDPISAEYGWLDSSGIFAGDAWWVDYKQAWYDPTTGDLVDLDYARRELPRLASNRNGC